MIVLFKRKRWRLKRASKAEIISQATDKILADKLYLDAGLKCIDVARAIGTNRTYLWAALSDRGLGFQEYMSRFRLRYFIERASAYRDLSCAEIAERCGFNDAKALNRHLKRMFGITLFDYMKKVNQGVI